MSIQSVLLTVSLLCLSCKHQTAEPEQRLFENLPSCCNPGPCNTPITLKGITGRFVLDRFDPQGNPSVDTIQPDTVFNLATVESILPLYKYYGPNFFICNLPELLKKPKSKVVRRVKFDCKLIYVFYPNNQVPQSDAYPVELTKIELID
jgi:hypothetical protein